jgi:DNA invertase Pin-like site-specific DNA recombinase
MNSHHFVKKPIEIFAGSLWSQRHLWRRAARLLPANSCLFVIDSKNTKQHELVQKISEILKIKIEISLRKDTKARRIDELLSRLNKDDVLLVAELSRLGRNMFEVINIINQLSENGVKLICVRQPELSTAGPHGKLLLAIYSYFAEAERDFISIRTKQGLAAARAKGKQLGRPKGSRDKERVLDPHREQIKEYLQLKIPLRRISSIINPHLEKPISYPAYQYFVRQDAELLELWQAQR